MHLGSEHRPARLLLNVENISFLSSTVLTRLVMLNNEIKARGGKIVLCNVSSNVNEIFKITGVSAQFEIYTDENAAFRAISE